jgi:hypothetical protein
LRERKQENETKSQKNLEWSVVTIVIITAVIGLTIVMSGCYGRAEPPRMKMTTSIPKSILTPDKIETRIGTLEFFDGFPNDETVEKALSGEWANPPVVKTNQIY